MTSPRESEICKEILTEFLAIFFSCIAWRPPFTRGFKLTVKIYGNNRGVIRDCVIWGCLAIFEIFRIFQCYCEL